MLEDNIDSLLEDIEETGGFISAYERNPERREVLSAMRKLPQMAPLMMIWDKLAADERHRTEYMRHKAKGDL